MKLLTKEQVNHQYRGKYIEIAENYDYSEQKNFYEIRKVYNTIHENTTLGEDVGTEMMYRR